MLVLRQLCVTLLLLIFFNGLTFSDEVDSSPASTLNSPEGLEKVDDSAYDELESNPLNASDSPSNTKTIIEEPMTKLIPEATIHAILKAIAPLSLDHAVTYLNAFKMPYTLNTIYTKTPEYGLFPIYSEGNGVTLKPQSTLDQINIFEMQEALKCAGYFTTIDGQLGPNTLNVLTLYKAAQNDLVHDQVIDDLTLTHLKASMKTHMVPEPSSLISLINKTYNLPAAYVPTGLVTPNVFSVKSGMTVRPEVKTPLETMFADAKKEGYVLCLASAYRSYHYQEGLFQRKLNAVGFYNANLYVALPGQSEHQSGLAVDISCKSEGYDLNESFENTPEGQWLLNNAYKYGFILRFPKTKVSITQYGYEPWHYRYIGDPTVCETIMRRGLCYEEYIEEINTIKAETL